MPVTRHPRPRTVLIIAATAALLPPDPVHAVNRTWVGPSGSPWSVASSWTTPPSTGIPVPGDNAYITLNPASPFSITYNASNLGGATGLNLLLLNSSTAQPLTLYQTLANANLTVADYYIADLGRATHVQTASTLTANFLTLANQTGSQAAYSLSGSGFLTGTALNVGRAGNASFSQSGGSVSYTNAYLGVLSGSTGSYALSGGSFTTTNLFVGQSGTGDFHHTAGYLQLGSRLTIAAASSSSGSFTLSGASASIMSYATTVGSQGDGSFLQSDGSHTVFANLTVAADATSNSTYSLTGGTLSTPIVQIGVDGTGTFRHSGGTHTSSDTLMIGYAGGTGSYSLSSAGNLLAPVVSVGYSGLGTFTQSGGTHTTTSSLTVGDQLNSTGRYVLSGGQLSTPALTLGERSTGTFDHTGGLATASTLTLADQSGASALYSLSGTGTLNAGTAILGNAAGASATFAQSGGAFTLTGAEFRLAPVQGSSATYNLSGGTLTVPDTAYQEFVATGGTATFNQTGGTHNVHSTYFTTGWGATGNGTYNLYGGTLNVTASEWVGWLGRGAVNQSGGSHTVGTPAANRTLYIADQPGSTGTYHLSAGSLTVHGTEIIGLSGPSGPTPGATGAFLQTGGSHSVSNTLSLAHYPGSTGSYTLAGGTLSVGSLNTNGDPARFQWTAGTLAITNSAFSLTPVSPLGDSLTLATPMTLSVAQPLSINGSLNLAGGTVTGAGPVTNTGILTGHGTLAGTGSLLNASLLSVAGGNLTLAKSGTHSNTGTLIIDPGRQLRLTGGPLTNAGSLYLNSATIAGPAKLTNDPAGTLTGPGAISTPFDNAGLLSLADGTLRTPSFTNTGVIELAGPAATLLPSATLTNAATLQGRGRVAGPLHNTATVEALAGTLTLAGPTTNAPTGTLSSPSNSKLLITGPFPTNAGLISLTGGTLDTSAQPLTNTGTIAGRGTLRTGTLTNQSQLQLSAGPSDIHSPVTNSPGAQILLSGNATATFYQPVTLSPNSELRISAGSTAVFFAPLTGPGQITGPGAKHFEAGASSPTSLATGGSTTLSNQASLTTTYINESSLTTAGPITLLPNSPDSHLTSLTLTPTGSLDLSNNTLTLTATPAVTIRQYLLNHQLFSSLSSTTHSVGYLLTNSTLTIKLTPTGDANLDGLINQDDYALLDRGFATNGSFWWQGDFTHDGQVDQQDYLLLDTTLAQQQGGHLSASLLSERAAQFGPTYVSTLLTSIPEPTPLLSALCSLLSLPLHHRRRRR